MRQRWKKGCALLLVLGAGCGSRETERTPVSGQVLYRGRPLAGGTIVFTPDPERGGRGPLALGEIDADGRYTLRTGDQPGAVPGWHRVTVAAADSEAALPRRYRDPDLAGLERQVLAGQANVIDLKLAD
jgi:hypothetical protein